VGGCYSKAFERLDKADIEAQRRVWRVTKQIQRAQEKESKELKRKGYV